MWGQSVKQALQVAQFTSGGSARPGPRCILCVMKRLFPALLLIAGVALAQSPAAQTEATVGGKKITIKYHAPSVKGRKIFGPDGLISKDPNFPVWRAGANEATALHTDADLMIGDIHVPKGDYTLFVDTASTPWQ